jgi:lipopolysaccharide transport system ATP-binding protein
MRAGEAVGVIGKNGAGKSTLLKLLSGLAQPTEGRIVTHASVASILELGIGLHSDFTGIENARQMALLQGIDTDQVESLLPRIEAFAEIGPYFHQPVRTYSSGMQMRLAFATATVSAPEILIVDEALAVGDAYFQHKCYERIREMRDAGTAVLFVSHDPTAVRSLCPRAILIDRGTLVHDGPSAEVLEHYNALLAPDIDRQHQRPTEGGGRRSGSGEVVIQSVHIEQGTRVCHSPISRQPATICMALSVGQPVEDLTVGILIRDRLGNDIFGTNTVHHELSLPATPGACLQLKWELFDFCLGPGHYSLTVAAHAGAAHHAGNYDWWDRALTFQVLPPAGPQFIGPSAIQVRVHVDAAACGDASAQNIANRSAP